MGRIGNPVAIPALLMALENPQVGVRAALALINLDAVAAIVAIELLSAREEEE